MEAALFDLDDTLLNSSALRPARDGKRWDEVMMRIDEVEAFDQDAHTLPERLGAQGLAVGIVTSSPRPYAEALLNRFGIKSDLLITGSDRYAPKPDPAALLAACEELAVDRAEVAYVGDQVIDFQAAFQAGMKAVGAMWSTPGGTYPPEWVRNWPNLAVNASGLLADPGRWELLRPIAEVTMEGGIPQIHLGSLIVPETEIFGLGRYFTRSDARCESHQLSQAIIANKSSYRNAAELSAALEIVARAARLRGAVVTSVPGPELEQFDRFAPYRGVLAHELEGTDRPDLLREVAPVAGYKHLRGAEPRDEANVGRFASTSTLDGEAVVLVDDVVTSGSTIRACREALTTAGASRVVSLVFAVTQEALPTGCPGCGSGILQYKERRTDGRPFWACSRWCGYLEDISPEGGS